MNLPEYDIDLFLQERGAEDPLAAEMIVRAYTPHVLRLARAVFGDAFDIEPCVEASFQRVMRNLPEYAPGGDFRSWLLKHSAQTCLANYRKAAARGTPSAAATTDPETIRRAAANADFTPNQKAAHAIEQALTESEPTGSLLLVLHYAEGYNLELCAQMLEISPHTAHAYLNQFRRDFENALAPAGELSQFHPHDDHAVHIDMRRNINADLDGLLTMDEANALRSHLLECAACQGFERSRRKIESTLSEVGANHWPLESAAPEKIAALIARAARSGAEGRQRSQLRNLLRESLWLALPVLLAVFFVLNYGRFIPQPDILEPPPPPPAGARHARQAPTATPAPTLGALMVYRANAEIRTASRPESQPANDGPRISADGNWVVFASKDRNLAGEDAQGYTDIFLYSRRADGIRRINLSPQGEAANGHSFSPAISADGNLITFSSYATNLVPGQTPACGEGQDPFDCAHVFLFDKRSDEIWLISEPDLSGLYSHISGDGRWIIYWAPAADVVQRDYCSLQIGSIPGPGFGCWDLIFYDRIQDVRSRLEIGKLTPPQLSNTLGVDVSYDGSRVVFEISAQDAIIAARAGAFESFLNPDQTFLGNHVVVYDRPTGLLQPVDANLNGKLSEGASYAGKISHDGRYVAFASSGDDLVAGDENRWVDIFVRDLDSETTERVSVTSQREELFADSPFMTQLGNWPTQFDISPDGEQIVFLSNAPELSAGDQAWCDTLTSGPVLCNSFYLHTRPGHTTEPLLLAPTAQEGVFSQAVLLQSPDLSGDGSLLAYAQEKSRCACGECLDQFIHSQGEALPISLTRTASAETQDTESWLFARNYDLDGGWVTALAFDPENPILASGSQDGSVRIWFNDAGGEGERVERSGTEGSTQLKLGPLDWREMYLLDFHSETITDIAFSPSGGLLATTSRDGTVALWWALGGSLRQVLRLRGEAVEAIAFSPGGRVLAAATRNGVWLWVQDEAGNFVHTETLPPYNQPVTSLDFSPDSRLLAVGGAPDGSVWLQPLYFNAIPIRLAGHDRPVSALAFSPGGGWLATASKDGSVNMWHYEWAGSDLLIEHRNTYWHADWVGAIAFSPDWRTLAAGTFSANLYLWDIETGDLMQTIQRTRQDQVMSVAFSPDERQLVYAGAQATMHVFTHERLKTAEQTTRFFRRYTDDMLEESLFNPSGLSWYYPSSQAVRSLDTPALAQDEVPFELLDLAGTDLKLTLYAVTVHQIPKTGSSLVVYNYIHTSDFQPSYLVFYQSPDNPREYASVLGASAKITEISMPGEDTGEFTQGDWLYDSNAQSTFGARDALHYHWDDEASSFRLRWANNGIYYSLEYHLPYNIETVYVEDRLQIEDLLAFAAGLQPVR